MPMVKCGECLAWNQVSDRRFGECRRRAASVNPITLGGPCWPTTRSDMFCFDGLAKQVVRPAIRPGEEGTLSKGAHKPAKKRQAKKSGGKK